MFERDLVTKFRLDHRAFVPIDRPEDESFAESLAKTANRVTRIMAQHGLESLVSGTKQVISGAEFVEPYGWTYSVRVLSPDED